MDDICPIGHGMFAERRDAVAIFAFAAVKRDGIPLAADLTDGQLCHYGTVGLVEVKRRMPVND